jgi:hypothetical protein
LPLVATWDKPLIQAIGEQVWDQEQAAGAAMTVEETSELGRSLTRAVPLG